MLGVLKHSLLKAGARFHVRYSSLINSHLNKNTDSNDPNIVHSTFTDIKLLDSTIPEYVFQNFGKYPTKIAVECAVTGKKYTYEELRRKSINFGKALQKQLKLKKGDTVAVLLPNVPDYPICILGALQASLVVTTLNPMYTPDEIKRQLVDANVKLLITLGQLWPIAQAAIKLLPHSAVVPVIAIKMMESEVLPQGAINFHELADMNFDSNLIGRMDVNELSVMPYSSGTTGFPKGVELSNRNILSNLQQIDDSYIRLGDTTTDNHQDIVPGILPWFHIYGLVAVLLNNLYNMSKLVSLPKFSPETYINMLDKHKPHILYVVPPLVLFMTNHPLVEKKHLQSIHSVCCGAAPLGALDEEKFQNKANKQINIVQGYGLTESCSCVFMTSAKAKKERAIFGSVGEPVSLTSIKITPPDDPYGQPLGPNKCGEILIKGPQMTSAYHKNPQESKEAFVDGWFRSGDIGYYNNANFFYITDRLKELIKVKGFQVAPAELEEIIRDYPGISDAAVIGIPHETFGEVPKAYIVPKPEVKIEVEKLQEYVASKVSTYKQLKGGVSIVESIPKTASGKIIKRELKSLYINEKKS